MPITWNLTFDSSWNVSGSGGNFAGDSNAVQGTLTAAQQMTAARACLDQVLAELRSYIDSTSTLNINIGWGTVASVPITGGGVIAASLVPGTPFTGGYEEMRNRMLRIKPNALTKIAYPLMPAVNPYAGNPGADGYDGFTSTWDSRNQTSTSSAGFINSTGVWDYSLTQTVGGGLYHLVSVMRHEISQALGRMLFSDVAPLGIFIFTAPGTVAPISTWKTNSGQYFSIDGGTTNLGNQQTLSAWDAGDFDGSSSTYCSLFSAGVMPTWGIKEWRQLALITPITPLLQDMMGLPSIQHIGSKWR